MLLLTGHKGHIGSKVFERIHNDVIVFNFGGRLEDKRDINYLKFDSVIHCAGSVPNNFFGKDSSESLEKNTQMTYRVLRKYKEAASKDSMFVFPSSISIGHQNPYSIGKEFCERLCAFFSLVYDLNISSPRIPSPYGPGMRESVMSLFVQRALENTELFIYDTEKTQTYMYIDDIVNWILYSYDSKESGVFSVDLPSVRMDELAELVIGILNSDSEIHVLKNPKRYYESDIVLKRDVVELWGQPQLASYIPKITLEEGIKKYAEFYLAKNRR